MLKKDVAKEVGIPAKHLMSLVEVSEALKIKEMTLYSKCYRNQGIGEDFKQCGRKWYFDARKIAKYKEAIKAKKSQVIV